MTPDRLAVSFPCSYAYLPNLAVQWATLDIKDIVDIVDIAFSEKTIHTLKIDILYLVDMGGGE